jgi:hypothetical protein
VGAGLYAEALPHWAPSRYPNAENACLGSFMSTLTLKLKEFAV